jgi:hypothetical protein
VFVVWGRRKLTGVEVVVVKEVGVMVVVSVRVERDVDVGNEEGVKEKAEEEGLARA